jgi:hypothetical protein
MDLNLLKGRMKYEIYSLSDIDPSSIPRYQIRKPSIPLEKASKLAIWALNLS